MGEREREDVDGGGGGGCRLLPPSLPPLPPKTSTSPKNRALSYWSTTPFLASWWSRATTRSCRRKLSFFSFSGFSSGSLARSLARALEGLGASFLSLCFFPSLVLSLSPPCQQVHQHALAEPPEQLGGVAAHGGPTADDGERGERVSTEEEKEEVEVEAVASDGDDDDDVLAAAAEVGPSRRNPCALFLQVRYDASSRGEGVAESPRRRGSYRSSSDVAFSGRRRRKSCQGSKIKKEILGITFFSFFFFLFFSFLRGLRGLVPAASSPRPRFRPFPAVFEGELYFCDRDLGVEGAEPVLGSSWKGEKRERDSIDWKRDLRREREGAETNRRGRPMKKTELAGALVLRNLSLSCASSVSLRWRLLVCAERSGADRPVHGVASVSDLKIFSLCRGRSDALSFCDALFPLRSKRKLLDSSLAVLVFALSTSAEIFFKRLHARRWGREERMGGMFVANERRIERRRAPPLDSIEASRAKRESKKTQNSTSTAKFR